MKFLVMLVLIGFSSAVVFAHNEDKPGPHGGFIRMPGGFHTELVMKQKYLEIYLLDFDFKHPQVANSSVKVSLKQGTEEKTLMCRPKKDRFICDLPKGYNSKQGNIVVSATRDGMGGGLAVYDFPLPKN